MAKKKKKKKFNVPAIPKAATPGSLEENVAKQVATAWARLEKDSYQPVFLLLGETGTGKSSTINSLLGREVAEVGAFEPTTMEVTERETTIEGVAVKVIDTPGLCDDLPEKGNDERYIKRIKQKVEGVDIVWFVARLDEPRVSGDERRGIKLISEAFGHKVWKNSIIVFTRADKVETSAYALTVRERGRLVREAICEYGNFRESDDIPVVSIANGRKTTPDGNPWLGELYAQSFFRMKATGGLRFFLATEKEISATATATDNKGTGEPRIPLTKPQKERVSDGLKKHIGEYAKLGEEVGEMIAGPVGKRIGKAVGSLVDVFINWW